MGFRWGVLRNRPRLGALPGDALMMEETQAVLHELAMQIIRREGVMVTNGAYAEARGLREACEMISAIRARATSSMR